MSTPTQASACECPRGEQRADPLDPAPVEWQSQLRHIYQTISAPAFEQLCKAVLARSGCHAVEVTGRTGDGGIDGRGFENDGPLRVAVAFQARRSTGSVGSPDIQQFRGAMIGRADRGHFFTTGTFTASAQTEANRNVVPTVTLYDGAAVARKLIELGIGVHVEVDLEWFAQLDTLPATG